MSVPTHMGRASPSQTDEHIRQIRELAGLWRKRASETEDAYYITLMTRTAEELEQHADALEDDRKRPPGRRHASLDN